MQRIPGVVDFPDVMRVSALVGLLWVGCEPGPRVDLTSPRVTGSSLAGPRTVQVPVAATIEVLFSESLDPAGVPGAVAMLAWREEGPCTYAGDCDEGACEHGTCQEDPVTSTVRSQVRAGKWRQPFPLDLVLAAGPAGPASRLRVTPMWPLDEHRRYTLLVGGIPDLSGSRHDYGGDPWRRDLVSAGRGSSGPEATLVWPDPGSEGVATNLAAVETSYPRPVELWVEDVAWLEPEGGGELVGLVFPAPCEGWVPGFCLRWQVVDPLRARVRYRPTAGTVRDVWGRDGWPAPQAGWFEAGLGADQTPPSLDSVEVLRRGPCVEVRRVGDRARVVASVGPKRDSGVGVSVHLGVAAPADAVTVTVDAEDVAGNVASGQWSVAAAPGGAPNLVLTEVLANPLGDEPEQEFVEVLIREDTNLDGLYLADRAWEEIQAALAAGDEPEGDPLPPVDVAAGSVIVLVADGHDAGASEDPAPAPGSRLLRLGASLGTSGLSNAGEPVTLYRADPAVLISSYGNYRETGATSHGGRSVVRSDPSRCDVRSAWVSHPGGRSTPGRLP